jgi:hypothetical protein
MREITGNLWDYHAKGKWVCITTNGSVRRDGYAVMGRGVAYEAAQRFPGLQEHLGRVLTRSGNHVWPFVRWGVATFPVKYRWMEKADIDLIEQSAYELEEKMSALNAKEVYLVRPGCGNGGLQWENVKPILVPILNDNFIIVERM